MTQQEKRGPGRPRTGRKGQERPGQEMSAAVGALVAGSEQLLGSGEVLNQVPGTGSIPKLVEASGKAREGGFEVFADLATNQGHLEDEIAAMANK